MRHGKAALFAAFALIAIGAITLRQLPAIAAGGLLYPARRTSLPPMPDNCAERTFAGEGVTLRGWNCRAKRSRRGTLIYLHGLWNEIDRWIERVPDAR